MKFFNKIVQSAVNATRQGDEKPNSSAVAETMKILAKSSYGYQIMNRSQHTVTKCLSDDKTHQVVNYRMFKHLGYIGDQLFDVELVKSEIKHQEPINVEIFARQNAKVKMLQVYYKLFDYCCVVTKFEKLEMDTNLLYLALSEHD